MAQVTKAEVYRKRRRNDAFLTIKSKDLNPADFVWDDWRITHLPTGDYFAFGPDGYTYSRPGLGSTSSSPTDRHSGLDVVGYQLQSGNFSSWLTDLKRWINEIDSFRNSPDLWESVHQDQRLATAAGSDQLDNRVFEAHEQRRIAEGLQEIKAFIQTTNKELEQSVKEHIDRRIEYLEESSRRLGRKDWLNIFVSTLMNIVVAAAFAPVQAQELYHLAVAILQPLYQTVLQLAGTGRA